MEHPLWVKQVSRALNTDPFMQAYQGSGNRYCQSSCLLVGNCYQRVKYIVRGHTIHYRVRMGASACLSPKPQLSNPTTPCCLNGGEDGLQPNEQTCPFPTSPSPYAHKPHSLTRDGFPSALHGVKCLLLHVTLAMEQVLDNFQ